MTPLEKSPHIFGSIAKIFKFEGGSLILTAWAASIPFVEFFKIIFHEVPLKDILMPIFVSGVSLAIYLLVFVFDFWYGIRASLHEGLEIQSNKLWSSMFKLMAVIIIQMGLCMFAFVFLPFDSEWVNNIFLWVIGTLGLAAFFFDVKSIGENYERRFGKKVKLFEWLNQLWEAINESILQKIKNFRI